jgi:oxygen-dependent protoporphyrinogen oxidase
VTSEATVADGPPEKDVVILGAGLSGLTAAYELRNRDIVVIERRDRVGGRTLSGTHFDYWYNSGAQFVWDPRTIELCQRLGLEVLDAKGARASLYLRGRLVRGANPYTLFLKLPLSLRERLDFGLTIMKLRRLASRMERLDSSRMDARPLAELMGDVSPITRTVMDRVSEGGTGLSTAEVSGWIGLGYAIHLFGGDVNDTLKQVAGGTQAISKAIRDTIGPEKIRLGSEVISVRTDDAGVTVRYRAENEVRTIRAGACIMATPANAVLTTAEDLPQAKRAALERMVPYGRIISVAWLTSESGRMPWDDLLVTPVIGELSFEQISNNAFFLQQRHKPQRRPGGCLVTLSTAARAERLWNLDDDAIGRLQRGELSRIYPSAAPVLADAEVRIRRWDGFPQFRNGWLQDQEALRAPLGRIYFCGDYTAQPGTPGAVGSGHHTARAVENALSQPGAATLAPRAGTGTLPAPALRSASADEPRG